MVPTETTELDVRLIGQRGGIVLCPARVAAPEVDESDGGSQQEGGAEEEKCRLGVSKRLELVDRCTRQCLHDVAADHAVDSGGRVVGRFSDGLAETVGGAADALGDGEKVGNDSRQDVPEHDRAHVARAQARREPGVRDGRHARDDGAKQRAHEQQEAVRTRGDVDRVLPEDAEQRQRRQRQDIATVHERHVTDDAARTPPHHQVGDQHHVTALEHEKEVHRKCSALWRALRQQRKQHPQGVGDEAAAKSDDRDADVDGDHCRTARLHVVRVHRVFVAVPCGVVASGRFSGIAGVLVRVIADEQVRP